MKPRKGQCKFCQREGLWVRVGWRRYPDGTTGPDDRMFDLDAVPTATCRVRPAIALSRSRGLVFIDTAHPTPTSCYPVHRCPQALDAAVWADIDSAADVLLDHTLSAALATVPEDLGTLTRPAERTA